MRRIVPITAAAGAFIVLMILAPGAAWADKRVALVIGNSTYQSVPQLANPSRDAEAVGQMFRDAGFDSVDVEENLGNLDFKRAVRKFETVADQADIAVIYYAGHGLEISGTNYIIPIDAKLASDRDAEDEAISLERVVSSADGAKKLHIVILDSCRDNPFTVSMRRERKTANRSISSGLGKIEPTSSDTLIAYAAKAGSTAEDGEGKHSPFTGAILKSLTVPGLDIRLAFGRVKDDVMKATGGRQEPFVYGSLGGDSIPLMPAAAVSQNVPISDIKADYELVEKIGSRKAWEVFLGTHPSGFYSDLARAQIDRIDNPATAQSRSGSAPYALASLGPTTTTPARESSSKERLEWEKVKDSTDISALQAFIKRFRDAPLAISAQQRIDMLKQAARERQEKEQAERDAAKKAAEDARLLAEQNKAALAAAKKHEEEERLAKAAEAEQKARAAEAQRKADEARRLAEEAERTKAAEAAAALRLASEKQAREAEAERQKAEAASAREAVCEREQRTLVELTAKGSEGSGLDELRSFARTVSCGRLGPIVVATLDRFVDETAKRAAASPNSPELIRSAQTQLARIGCFGGKPDGALSSATKGALDRYLTSKGRASTDLAVTQELVSELTQQSGRVCPLECKAGETASGDVCIANKKEPAPAVASHRRNQDEETPASRNRTKTQASRPQPSHAAAEAPQARQQASAKPNSAAGGSGNMVGVGF